MTADRVWRAWWCGFVTLLVVACSTPSSDSSVSTSTPPSSASAAESAESSATTSVADDSTAVSTVVGGTEDTVTVAPLRPYDDSPSTVANQATASAYISRVSMSASSIELTWSAPDDVAEYRLHRVPRTSDVEPSLDAMTAENQIHVATEAGRFVDDGVESGVRYWFGVRALDTNGGLLSSGWHAADAVTDTEPPSPVGDLSAVVDGGDVVLSWSKPEENYELHGYQVFRVVDDGEPESIATTWRVEQTSLIDDQVPSSGKVAYEVVAFDFHWNESTPAQATLDRP